MSDVDKWLEANTIFHSVVGSRAYGLHNAESDYDYRGVAIAPVDYYLGLNRFEQRITKAPEPDSCIFDIKKFFDLALSCNPNIIEFMFLDKENVLRTTESWDRIVANRDLFLSKRAKHRYLGYAFSQLKRVKSHKHWLLNPADHKPTRSEYGLPDAVSLSKELIGSIESVIKVTLKDNIEQMLACSADDIARINLRNFCEFDLREALDTAFTDFSYPTVFNKLCNNIEVIVAFGEDHFTEEVMRTYTKEKQFGNAMANWKQYQEWVTKRNPARAILEEKFGFDTKHVGHVFRLLIQGREILEDGTLHVMLKPEDKEFILAIKAGAYTYDHVLSLAELQMSKFDDLYKSSRLPHSPDFNKANTLLVNLIEDFYKEQK